MTVGTFERKGFATKLRNIRVTTTGCGKTLGLILFLLGLLQFGKETKNIEKWQIEFDPLFEEDD